MKIPRLIVTKEHGSWAVLLVPMIIGAGVAHVCSSGEVLLAVAALCIFMSYVPLQMILRDKYIHPQGNIRIVQSMFWIFVFNLAAALAGIVLLSRGLWLLLLVGAAGAACFLCNFLLLRYYQKSVGSDLVTVAGLTLGAPAMYYVATTHLDQTALSLWILNALFFGSSVFYVHMKMLATGSRKAEFTLTDRISIGKLNILYHFVVIVLVLILALSHLTSLFILLAFVPMTLHALIGTYRLSSRVRYRELGYALLVQSIIFSFLILLIENR